MSGERDRIERMVQEGKLSRSEADELLTTLDAAPAGEEQPSTGSLPRGARRLHVLVNEARGEHVDLRFPVRLVNVALGIAAKRGTMTVDGTPVDVDEIRRLVADPSFTGELMNVHTDDGTSVVLTIE
ncbi:MAG TPA: hypothetical protein PLZ61_04050 [Candidatus Cryosericum sp.]|nr:hypothetical protein [Candidatus Cryosericum sp.]